MQGNTRPLALSLPKGERGVSSNSLERQGKVSPR